MRISAHRHGTAVTATSFGAGTGVTVAEVKTWRTTLSLVVRRSVDPDVLRGLLVDEVARMDRAVSRFREDSEISAVNRAAGTWVPVSAYFQEVVGSAVTASELTGGLVDPGVGAHVDAAGYRHWRDGSAIPERPATAVAGMVEFREDGAVRIPPAVQLDVGAVAKGWLADRLANAAAQRFACDALANMGGDLRAVGEDHWVVAADPGVPGVEAEVLQLSDAGLATSSIGRRRWTNPDGSRGHHIIDPRTGASAETIWTSCSVIAATAAQANTASTAALILSEGGPSWLAEQDLDGWFVASSQQQRVGRWPQDRPIL